MQKAERFVKKKKENFSPFAFQAEQFRSRFLQNLQNYIRLFKLVYERQIYGRHATLKDISFYNSCRELKII
jgi:hypothetical protein